MTLRAYRKHETDDYHLQQVQDNVSQVLNAIPTDIPIANGELLSDIAITTGTKKIVSHKLGRKLQGYMVVLRSANAVIWDNQSTNATPSRTLELNSSANVTISIWVF